MRYELGPAVKFLQLQYPVALVQLTDESQAERHGVQKKDHAAHAWRQGVHVISVNEPSFDACDHDPNECVAHELIHALQTETYPGGPSGFLEAYDEADAKYGYSHNPYEIAADELAVSLAARFQMVSPSLDPASVDNP